MCQKDEVMWQSQIFWENILAQKIGEMGEKWFFLNL